MKKSVGVMDDERTYDYAIALRVATLVEFIVIQLVNVLLESYLNRVIIKR